MLTTLSHLEKQIKCILFDLDGTLLDSSFGIFTSIEHAFSQHGLKVDFDHEQLRQYAGNGVTFLLQKIDRQLSKDQLQALKESAFAHYQRHAGDHSRCYPGIKQLFMALKSLGIHWGIITNKTRQLSLAVIESIPMYEECKLLVCADDLAYKKPHPMPILHALAKMNHRACQSAYVGDTLSDMQAAKYSGCFRIFAEYGYANLSTQLDRQMFCDVTIENLEQLRQWITSMWSKTERHG